MPAKKLALDDNEVTKHDDEWYLNPKAADGKTWTTDDFRMALCISKSEAIRLQADCIEWITSDYVTNELDHFKVVGAWSGTSGLREKEQMIDDFSSRHKDYLVTGTQFMLTPPEWDKAKRQIVAKLIIWANTKRSRDLDRKKNADTPRHNRPSRGRSAVSSDAQSIRQSSATPSGRQSSVTPSLPAGFNSLEITDDLPDTSTSVLGTILNNGIIRFRYKEYVASVSLLLARKEGKSPGEPLYASDVDLDKFYAHVRAMIDDDDVEEIDIWVLNQVGNPIFIKVNCEFRLHMGIMWYFQGNAEPPPNTFLFTVQDKGEPRPEVGRKRALSVDSTDARKRQQRDTEAHGNSNDELMADRGAQEVIVIQDDPIEESTPTSASEPPKQQVQTTSTTQTATQKWDGVHIIIAPPKPSPKSNSTADDYIVMGDKVDNLSFDGHTLQGLSVVEVDNTEEGGEKNEDSEERTHTATKIHAEATDNSVFEHMAQKDWKDLVEFFELGEISDHIAAKTPLRFPGLRSSIAPYQLVAAYFNLKRMGRDQHFRGGYIADKMGFGKSLETLLTIALFRLVKRAQDEVELCQEDGEETHNPADAKIGAPCPSRSKTTGKSKWPFACPCEKGPASKLKLMEGPSLILSPPNLIGNWQKEFRKHMDFKSKLNGAIELFVVGLKGQEARDCEQFSDKGISNYHITDKDLLEGKAGQPAPDTTHIIVLMSKSLVPHRLYTNSKTLTGLSDMRALRWGRIVVDETHQSKTANTDLFKFLFKQPLYAYILFLSATPWDKSPKDIQPPIQIIQRKFHKLEVSGRSARLGFVEDTSSTKGMSQEDRKKGAWRLATAGSAWNAVINASKAKDFDPKSVANKTQIDTATSIIQNVLELLVIRRSEKSVWKGSPLVPMPIHEHRDVYVELDDPKLLARLEEMIDKIEKGRLTELQSTWDTRKARGDVMVTERPKDIAKGDWIKLMRPARIFGCFPHLLDAEISLKDTLIDAISVFMESDENEQTSWAYQHLDLIHMSPKIQCLKSILDQLGPDEPCPIFSANPSEAFATYMWLKYKYNKGTAELFHSGLNKEQKNALIDRFLETDSTKSQTRFIIGRYETLGVGYTLVRAKRCFLMQPDWLRSFEEQSIGRVWRTTLAQKAPKTSSYRFILKGFTAEEIIVARHDARGIMSAEVFNDKDKDKEQADRREDAEQGNGKEAEEQSNANESEDEVQ